MHIRKSSDKTAESHLLARLKLVCVARTGSRVAQAAKRECATDARYARGSGDRK